MGPRDGQPQRSLALRRGPRAPCLAPRWAAQRALSPSPLTPLSLSQDQRAAASSSHALSGAQRAARRLPDVACAFAPDPWTAAQSLFRGPRSTGSAFPAPLSPWPTPPEFLRIPSGGVRVPRQSWISLAVRPASAP